jgi:molybdenum cofactor cytidylyltransferase
VEPADITRGAIVGVLLAAGSASRFGGGKLMALMLDGTPVGVASLRRLAAQVDNTVAVIRASDAESELARRLADAGARVTVCPQAAEGMGRSLAWGVRAAPLAAGWIVMLGDMPWIDATTIAAVVGTVRDGALIAAPRFRGERAHPVGFAAACYGELAALRGDEGARRVVATHVDRLTVIDVDDAGSVRDVDTPADLRSI